MLVKTETGLEIEFDESKLDDWDTVEILMDIDNGSQARIVDLAKRVFPNDLDKIKAHVLKNEGRVSFSGMSKEIYDIFNSVEKLKN